MEVAFGYRQVTLTNRTLRLTLAALMTVTGGCSLVLTDGPPANHSSMPHFDCTSSRMGPTGDLIVGGLFGVGMLRDSAEGLKWARDTPYIGGGVVIAATLATAAYGLRTVERCRDAKLALAARASAASPNDVTPVATLAAPAAGPWTAEGPAPAAARLPPPADASAEKDASEGKGAAP